MHTNVLNNLKESRKNILTSGNIVGSGYCTRICVTCNNRALRRFWTLLPSRNKYRCCNTDLEIIRIIPAHQQDSLITVIYWTILGWLEAGVAVGTSKSGFCSELPDSLSGSALPPEPPANMVISKGGMSANMARRDIKIPIQCNSSSQMNVKRRAARHTAPL
jgi:hypothetical protein